MSNADNHNLNGPDGDDFGAGDFASDDHRDASGDRELFRLASNYCDSVATQEELAQLVDRVKADPAALDRYLAYVDMHSQLQWHERGERTLGVTNRPTSIQGSRFESDPIAAIDAMIALAGDGASPDAKETDSTNHESPAPPTLPVRALRSIHQAMQNPASLALTVAVVVNCILIGGLAWLTSPKPGQNSGPIANNSSAGAGSNGEGTRLGQTAGISPTAPQFYRILGGIRGENVGIITASDSLVWSPIIAPKSIGAPLRTGDLLAIQEGLVELKFDSGDRLIVEGPSQLYIQAAQSVALLEGRLVGYAAEKKGFTVFTSKATFVDLGTVYGIHAPIDGPAELCVFSGAVEARIGLPGEVAQLFQRVMQGQAIAVDGQGVTPIAAERRIAEYKATMPLRVRRSIAVANSDFESPKLRSGIPWIHGIDGWAASASGVSNFLSNFRESTPSAGQVAFLNEGEIRQTIAENLQRDQTYELSVWVGNRPGSLSPRMTLELWAGQTLLASETLATVPADGCFTKVGLVFTAQAGHAQLGQPLSIVIRSQGSLANQTQNILDDVKLDVLTIQAPSVDAKDKTK